MNIDFIIPSYYTKILTSLCIRSFEKYKSNYNFRYIVVENSNDTSYKEHILSLANSVQWVQNPTKLTHSAANAIAIEAALPYVQSEYVFICHNDVVACHKNWLDYLVQSMKEMGGVAASYVIDNARINALHSSGILVKTNIVQAVSVFPVYEKNGRQILDVTDSITQYCRDNNLQYFYCRNTHNNEEYEQLCNEPYRSLPYIDRALDSDNNVIFLHLGRGHEKAQGIYTKANRLTLDGWFKFVEKYILAPE